MRDKTNFAKITSRWLNIVGIHGRSRVSNGTQDFDLAMRSTKVDRYANYGFQHASRTSNLSSSKTLRNNCGLCRVFLTWLMKWYVPRACLHPWWPYTISLDTALKVTTWDFWAEKKTPEGACALLCHADFILACPAKFLIYLTWSDPWSVIRTVTRSLIWSVIRSGPIRSDPVRSGPIQILSTPQTQGLRHFRNHSRSF